MNSRNLIYLLMHMFTITIIVHCEDENYFENTLQNNPDELTDPHSFYYDKQSKKMIEGVQVEVINDNSPQNEVKSSKQTDDFSEHEAVFYKRLINLLLSNINIQEEDNLGIIGTLQIEALHSQMELLKNFDVEKTSLREIDHILSNIIQKPKNNDQATTPDLFDKLQNAFDNVFLTLQFHTSGILIAFAVLIMFFVFVRMIQIRKLSILLFIQIIFISSYFMTWWHLLEEAEIKAIADQTKFSSMPISCQPHQMTSWDKVVSFFSRDDCEQYYKTLMSNYKLKITPAFVLSHFISTVVLHPVTILGTAIGDFIENCTAKLSGMSAFTVKLMLFSCVGLLISMMPYWLFGSSIGLGFGPLFRFGINNRKNSKKGNTNQSIENREPIQIILKISQGAEVPQIQNNSAVAQLEASQVKTDVCKMTAIADTDTQNRCDDLSSGDTVKNIECSKCCKVKESLEFDAREIGKEDGSGDN